MGAGLFRMADWHGRMGGIAASALYAIIPSMLPLLRHIPIAPRLANRRREALDFLIVHSGLLTCALFLLAGLSLLGDYGIGADQGTQRRIAEANLNYALGRVDGILVNNDQFALVPSDRFYGVAFELPLLLAERALGLEDLYYVNRLRLTLTYLFFIIGSYFCYRLAYRLFGSRLLAIMALLFLLLHPRIYGHSFFNSKDLPFLSMFLIALYLLERAFRRDTVGAFVLLGIAVGLLTNLRIMGIMLFPAVIAMRGLDWLPAGGGPERRRVLLTAGLFTLTAGLTWYAVTPYAWPNPIEHLAGSLGLTVGHPTVVPILFQGALIPSDQLPWHYLPIWFLITTPPFILLLIGCGAAAVVARSCRRPGTVFRQGRPRFLLLLLACFLLPPLAAALLGSNQYDDWRHLYFVYGPAVLLAAGGLRGLTAAWPRQGRWRAGAYGLAGLGLGLILVQMAQLHPLQYVYFNFLVDRTTPEELRERYDLDYWELAQWPALQYLLARYPGETLTVRTGHRSMWEALPPAARRRLPLTAGRDSDFDLTDQPEPSQPDLAFNSAYPRRFYNNTLAILRPAAAAWMTADALAAYRELYREARAGEPIIRGNYDVYLKGRRLTFVRENCRPEQRKVWFRVDAFPPHEEILPPGLWEPGSYASYYNQPVRLGSLCLAVIQLPAETRGNLILDQRGAGKPGPASQRIWEQELYSLSRPGLGELSDRRREKQPPAGPAAFAVFLDWNAAGRPGLFYAKESCSQAEYENPAFLQIYPENLADLPFYLWAGGQENREFPLSRYGFRPGGDCMAVVPLPDYPIAALRTGQFGVWEVNRYPPAAPGRLRETYAALAALKPNRRAAFALYWRDNRLIYLRENCAAADTAAGFFLHIIPADVAVLPAERRAAGFANGDFAFDRRGGHFDGKCLAAIPLPNYPVKAIRTGQYSPEQGELWAVELAVGR